MGTHGSSVWLVGLLLAGLACAAGAADPPHPLMTWVKRHPREEVAKPSPRMGYETSYGYDWLRETLIRYGGHNQGGGGEQNSEVWTYGLDTDAWTLKEPNDAPPGVCCAQQNVFHDALRKFIRFPAFSGSHGWQSFREIYLKNSSVWTYDLDTNTWRYMRPCPEVWPSPLRGAAYDPHHEVVVLHGGENSGHGTVVYDLYTNTWHKMDPKPAPPASLSQPGFTYDAVNRVFVLFGSQFASHPETWVYDLRKNAWRVLDVKEHPPADKTSPVLAADTRNGIVLCCVQTAGEDDNALQTWALDVAKSTWTRLKAGREPDPSGNRNRVLLYLPDRNLFVLENRNKDEQQIWTFRYADAPPPPFRIQGLKVGAEADHATLTWELTSAYMRPQFDVYRGEGTRPWEVDLKRVAEGIVGTKHVDRGLRKGVCYFYQVRNVLIGQEVGASFIARAQPAVPLDLCVSVPDAKRVELEWAKAEADDVAGYHVERADVAVYSTAQVKRIRIAAKSDMAVGRIRAIGPFQRLTQQPVEEPRFVDDTVDLAAGQRVPAEPVGGSPLRPDALIPDGKPYRFAVHAYRIVAVTRLGVESGPSPLLFTYPAAVQSVFSKEEGGTTRLKWQASRHKGLKGYLVYRHDGRWDKNPIVRLTPEPIAATEFVDANAGEPTRRYDVVAVDALGQEGEPSRPVWSRREWRKFYVPYVGEWHQ